MSNHVLFDSYSGEHVDDVLRQIEDRNASETRREADSEFLRGERSAVAEIRRILASVTYSPRRTKAHAMPALGGSDHAVYEAAEAAEQSRGTR